MDQALDLTDAKDSADWTNLSQCHFPDSPVVLQVDFDALNDLLLSQHRHAALCCSCRWIGASDARRPRQGRVRAAVALTAAVYGY